MRAQAPIPCMVEVWCRVRVRSLELKFRVRGRVRVALECPHTVGAQMKEMLLVSVYQVHV